MTAKTWKQLGGSFYGPNDGRLLPEIKLIQWLLDLLDEIFTEEVTDGGQLHPYELVIPLPGGYGVEVVDKYGNKTDIKNALPAGLKKEFWGFRFPIVNQTWAIPKRDFPSTGIMMLSSIKDWYWKVDSTIFKKWDMDGNEVDCVYGAIADTSYVLIYAAAAYAIYKFLKATNAGSVAKKLMIRIYRFIKNRRLKNLIKETNEAVVLRLEPAVEEMESTIVSLISEVRDQVGLKLSL